MKPTLHTRFLTGPRGMISAETVTALQAHDVLYILGVRERTDKLVRDLVLNDAAPFVPLTMERRGTETDYSAKTVTLGGARYIVCINHQEAEKDAADRAAILASLERQLRRGDKVLVGNTGYRRNLKTVGDGHFAIDRAKAEEDTRFDGVFVLRTNTDLNPVAPGTRRSRAPHLWRPSEYSPPAGDARRASVADTSAWSPLRRRGAWAPA